MEDGNDNLSLSCRGRLENVDKRWASWVRWPVQGGALQPDGSRRHQRDAILRRPHSSESYLYLLAHCRSRVLSIVREIEGQHLSLDTRRGHADLLTVCVCAEWPPQDQDHEHDTSPWVRHGLDLHGNHTSTQLERAEIRLLAWFCEDCSATFRNNCRSGSNQAELFEFLSA